MATNDQRSQSVLKGLLVYGQSQSESQRHGQSQDRDRNQSQSQGYVWGKSKTMTVNDPTNIVQGTAI